jgi:hypothetical protein
MSRENNSFAEYRKELFEIEGIFKSENSVKYLHQLENILKSNKEFNEILDKFFEVIKKYDSPTSEGILRGTVDYISSYEGLIKLGYKIARGELIKSLDILEEEKIVSTLKNFRFGKIREELGYRIAPVVLEEGKEKIYKMIDVISDERLVKTINYKNSKENLLLSNLIFDISRELVDNYSVNEIRDLSLSLARLSENLDKNDYKRILNEIYFMVNSGEDIEKIVKFVKLVDIVLPEIVDWSTYSLIEIVENNLTDLIIRAIDRNVAQFVMLYLKYKLLLPEPNLENIDRYDEIVAETLRKDYGISKNLSYREIEMFLATLSSGINMDEWGIDLKKLVELINKSERKNERIYRLDTGECIIDYLKRYEKDDLIKYTVISLTGSHDKNLESEARNVAKIFADEKDIEIARQRLNENKYLKKRVIEILKGRKEGKNRAYQDAYNLLLHSGEQPIVNVMKSIDYERDELVSKNIIRATESNNPLDFDFRFQKCCAYLPYGAKRKEIFTYCEDPRIMLVKYEIYGKPQGSAICYLGDDYLLVDSVEGDLEIAENRVFDIIFNDLLERAKMRNLEYILFNIRVYNETPRKFISYIEKAYKKLGLRKDYFLVDFKTDAYLEAMRIPPSEYYLPMNKYLVLKIDH